MRQVGEAATRIYDTLWRLTLRGENPSVRELAQAAKVAGSTASTHLATLRAAGWVAWREGTTRSLRIVGGPRMVDRDVVDLSEHAVAAGPPIPTAAIAEALQRVNRQPIEGTVFTIRAQGDSMMDKAILDGVTLVLRPQQHPRHGALVVAALPDGTDLEGATVMIYDTRHGRPRLLAANPAYAPIESDELRIVGKVLEVWRRVAA